MTTLVYPHAQAPLISGAISWSTAAIKAMLLTSLYAPIGSDTYVHDIPSAAIIVRSAALTNRSISADGVYLGLIPQFSELLFPLKATALVLYVDSGADTTSQLLYYSSDGLGFPFLPTGINYYVACDSVRGFFKLVTTTTPTGHLITQSGLVFATQSGLEILAAGS